ncbi:MAG: threonylcarbamoyl-AMP synthase [Lachnoclostridium sp.]|jgi:L-threonylcarbamoyladenylate synthase|nr:threonylcarbamoyl-AMP synthase [Lachnoclostridium sp.]
MKTKYIVWDEKYGFQKNDLEEAGQIIADGGLIAFPTETVYGLGGNGLQSEAADKIYAAKGRPSDNPLILHIGDKDHLQFYVKEISIEAKKLCETFWPGPLTMIFDKDECIPYTTTGGLDTVAVRMPRHVGALAFLKSLDFPVAAPSANLSGKPSPTDATHVKDDLDGRIDMIIDGGRVDIGIESTIVDMTGITPVILRPGSITKEMLKEVIGQSITDFHGELHQTLTPKAPGMKYRHYAPKAKMTVVDGHITETVTRINDLVSKYPSGTIGILATEETKDQYRKGYVVSMGSRKERTLSRELYRAIREVDRFGINQIFAEGFSKEPNAEALMNRLEKAAGHNIITL